MSGGRAGRPMGNGARWVRWGAGAAALVLVAVAAGRAAGADLERHDHVVPSSADPASRIYVREKRPARPGPGAPALLLVHGLTAPTAFFATHFIHLEHAAPQLYREVLLFLGE